MPEEVKTILIVDDTPENIRVLTPVLSPHYRVKAATSGEKALKLCAVDPLPDLILLDVIMPEVDGYEVCRRLKADARTARIPVIFVTSLGEPGEEERGRALGAADFVSKPVDPAVVLARVSAAL